MGGRAFLPYRTSPQFLPAIVRPRAGWNANLSLTVVDVGEGLVPSRVGGSAKNHRILCFGSNLRPRPGGGKPLPYN